MRGKLARETRLNQLELGLKRHKSNQQHRLHCSLVGAGRLVHPSCLTRFTSSST